jgi:hypothetical protein
VGAYNIRLENDDLETMGVCALPIYIFSIFYYPFCFLIALLSGLSKNSLVRGLADSRVHIYGHASTLFHTYPLCRLWVPSWWVQDFSPSFRGSAIYKLVILPRHHALFIVTHFPIQKIRGIQFDPRVLMFPKYPLTPYFVFHLLPPYM